MNLFQIEEVESIKRMKKEQMQELESLKREKREQVPIYYKTLFAHPFTLLRNKLGRLTSANIYNLV